jgi:hypothetical protein
MERLERAVAELVAMRPGCKALTNLALDCWKVGAQRGEAEGLLWAENVRQGVLRYVEHERHVASFGAWPKGAE